MTFKLIKLDHDTVYREIGEYVVEHMKDNRIRLKRRTLKRKPHSTKRIKIW
jgi:hypothetical protein